VSSKTMSLKAKIKNLAKAKNIAAQVILQNYMFERFLERVSVSVYKNKFILKGGMLVAAIVGLDTRSTMDLDATLKAYPLTEESIKTAFTEICAISINDDVIFKVVNIEPIRPDDDYGGYSVRLDAVYDVIITPLSVDVSTGDIVTPKEVPYLFKTIFDDNKHIELWAYNIETVLAEKVETVLRRGVFNTRPRDYYDIYILSKTQKFDKDIFLEALTATAQHRKTKEQITNTDAIIKTIGESSVLKLMWERYRKEFNYAADIAFEDTVQEITDILQI